MDIEDGYRFMVTDLRNQNRASPEEKQTKRMENRRVTVEHLRNNREIITGFLCFVTLLTICIKRYSLKELVS